MAHRESDVEAQLARKRDLIAGVAYWFIRRHGWIEFDDAFQIVSLEALTILTDPVLCDVDAAIMHRGYLRLLDELRSGRVNGVTRSGFACGVRAASSLNEVIGPDGSSAELLQLLPTDELGYDQVDVADQAAFAMEGLPERERMVVYLYFFESLTQAEIGELLGVDFSRISQLLTRARQRMAGRLAA